MSKITRLAIWTGGIALLAATAIDTVAVIGRHVGMPLGGSIELMQAAVLVSGALGIVISSLDDAHARVKLLVDRMPESWRGFADRASDGLSLLFVLALLAGSAWIALDLRGGHEESELVGVPWWLLRLVANACLLVTALILGWRVIGRAK
jgi:TRAP-type C4-dicarboxylate transport system permease small subunit